MNTNICLICFCNSQLGFYVNHLIHFGPPKCPCTVYRSHNVDNYMFNYDHTRIKINKTKLFRWCPLLYCEMIMTERYICISFHLEQSYQFVYFSAYPNFILISVLSYKPGYKIVMLCLHQTEFRLFKVILFCHTESLMSFPFHVSINTSANSSSSLSKMSHRSEQTITTQGGQPFLASPVRNKMKKNSK